MISGDGELQIGELSRLLSHVTMPSVPDSLKARTMLQVEGKLTAKDLALCTAFGVNPIALLLARAEVAEEQRMERWREQERARNNRAAQEAIARHDDAERERMSRLSAPYGGRSD